MSDDDRRRSCSPNGGRLFDRDSLSGNSPRRRSRSRSFSRSRSRSYSRSRSPSPQHRRKHRSKRSYSRSRSRSRSPRRHRSYSRSMSRSWSRSRSRSFSPRGGRRRSYKGGKYRSRSRSPLSNRKRHQGDRYNPKPSRVLGVFGLSLYTGEKDLKEMLNKYGPIDRVQVVYDHQTGRSRGFAFVYFKDVEDAMEAKEQVNGTELDGRRLRVDYSITKRPHTPTPGVYMGRPTRSSQEDRYERGYERDRYYDDHYSGGSSGRGYDRHSSNYY